MLFNIGLLIIGLFALIMGGDFLVRGASSLALRLHMTPLVVGLTIVAFGTSAPELLISLSAALSGSPDLAMGNVLFGKSDNQIQMYVKTQHIFFI